MRIFPPYGTGSSNATVFGISVFGMSETLWYYPIIMSMYRVLKNIDSVYYYLYHRFVQKYHILRLPLPYSWIDADTRMFEACFTILGQYVEDELGTEPYSYQNEDSIYRGYRLPSGDDNDKKAIDLWLWYKHDLPALEKDYDDDITTSYSGKFEFKPVGDDLFEMVSTGKTKEPKYEYNYPETVKDEKLKELIDLRRSLWT